MGPGLENALEHIGGAGADEGVGAKFTWQHVAAAAAANQYFGPGAVGSIEQDDVGASAGGEDRRGHAGSTGADDGNLRLAHELGPPSMLAAKLRTLRC